MKKRKKILRKVKSYTDIELNPSKRNLYDPARDDFEEASSIEDTSDYEAALSISNDNNLNYILRGLYIWILNAPKSSTLTKEDYTTWVDNIIRADIPDSN